jgi:hypothetical protein
VEQPPEVRLTSRRSWSFLFGDFFLFFAVLLKLAAQQVAHSRAYSTAWEWVRESGYDSFSEILRDE